MGEDTPTFTLFARPSLIEGMARVMDFGGTLNTYNNSPTPEMADMAALASDTAALTQDGRVVALEVNRVGQTSDKAV